MPEAEVEKVLVSVLKELRTRWSQHGNYFLCGISQIAIGSDTAFTRACVQTGTLQRLFLPQHRDAYLSAIGSKGVPDFTPEQQTQARALMDDPHILQERVVSDSPDRDERFEDSNREIVRVSDLLICVVCPEDKGLPGGTKHLIGVARSKGKAVFTVNISIGQDGKPALVPDWDAIKSFCPPTLPHVMDRLALPTQAAGGALPSVADFCAMVKQHASGEAVRLRDRFGQAALVIILTHILATLLATIALAGHGPPAATAENTDSHSNWLLWLLGGELIMLAAGFGVHLWLHRSHPTKLWAIARLLAEISRSVRALGHFHYYPAYLFKLHLPAELTPLLRTVNVLHLISTQQHRAEPWEPSRNAYVATRLTNPDPEQGQPEYYKRQRAIATRWLKITDRIFIACSLLAIFSTFAKFGIECRWLPCPESWKPTCVAVLGGLAVVLPVLAVGALSWSAAQDYEARAHSFDSMVHFLGNQIDELNQAASRRTFEHLLDETESRLLGETAEWYSRRIVGVVA